MEYIILIVLQSVWFSLPIYLANMVPVLVKHVPFLDIPIDGGLLWKGKEIFGSHKTIRGFLFGVSGAIIVVFLQQVLFAQGGVWRTLSIADYDSVSFVFLGFLLGFGALAGDAIESFFKRRIGIEPGKPWLFFDQVDYIIGALIFVSILFVPPIVHMVTMIVLAVAMSFISSYIGYHVGLKDSEV